MKAARPGAPFEINSAKVEFSFWPIEKTATRNRSQYRVFVSDPWPLVHREIRRRPSGPAMTAAAAFASQAEDLLRASTYAKVSASKPLLLYYGFLNVVKAYLLMEGGVADLGRSCHGMSEKMEIGDVEFKNSFLAIKTRGGVNVFTEFIKALGGIPPAENAKLPLSHLAPQIVPGHRLWAGATDESERHIALHNIALVDDRKTKDLWLRLYIERGHISRLYRNPVNFLADSHLGPDFHLVKNSSGPFCFEQGQAMTYRASGVDVVDQLVASLKNRAWAVVLIQPPYRRYYAYCCPSSELGSQLPQLASIYAVMYYLSSITRYRPHLFNDLINGPLGPWIESFLNDQPAQFTYLLTSYLTKRDVTRAAIVTG
jgi:hypothetical protein